MRKFPIILLLLLSGCLHAQEVEFTASVTPNALRVGEQLNLTYTSNQELEEMDLPEIPDFEILGGPSQGRSQSVYSVNGKVTTSSTYQYTYFLRAVKEGKFTIPAASAKIKGKTYRSNSLNVEVIKAVGQTTSQPQSGSKVNDSQSPDVNENDLFVRLILDKKEAYIGEQIMATVKIYTKTTLSRYDQGFKGPDFTGFFTEPIEVPALRNLQREVIEGDIYYTGVIRKLVIIPQKTGELTIQPFDLDVTLRREVRRKIADPFFEDFSIPDVQEIPVKLRSKTLRVSVKPMPVKAPASFKGAVGSFRLNASMNKKSTLTNEPLTLKLTISGTGNLKLINELEVNVPYDMEKYDPVINTRFDNPLSGTKTFEFLIIPKVAGQFVLPPVEFTFFDPVAQQYRTLLTQSFPIDVVKGPGDTLLSVIPGVAKEDVTLLNQDIRFIKTKPFRVYPIHSFMAHNYWYYLLFILALLVFTFLLALRNRIVRQKSDVAGLRLRRADKYARKRLRKSEWLLKQGNDNAFFEELLGAIWGYLSDKLNIPVALLSKDSASAALRSRTVNEETARRLFSITESCEIARYGRNSDEISKESLYHEALEIISLLQQELKSS